MYADSARIFSVFLQKMTLKLAVSFAGLLALAEFAAAQSAAWGQCKRFLTSFLHGNQLSI
jgi:hypothetical protein